MKKKLLITLLIVVLIAEILFLVTRSISMDKVTFIKKITQLIPAQVEIKGKIKVNLFPVPKLVASHVRIQDVSVGNYKFNIRAEKLESSISILKLITGDFQPESFIIDNAKLEMFILKQNHVSLQKPLQLLTKQKSINNILITNSKFDIININKQKNNSYQNFNLTVDFEQKIKLTAAFSSQLEDFKVTGDIDYKDNYMKSDFQISFSDSVLNFNSQYDELNNFNGKVKVIGKDIKKFIFNNLFSMWFFFPDNDQYSFELSFDFVESNNKFFINNGKLSSDPINGVFESKQNNDGVSNLDINFVKFDFNKLLSKQKKSYIMEEMAFLKLDEKSSGMPLFIKKDKIKINLILKTLVLKNNNIKNVNLELLFNNNIIELNDLSFSLTDNDINNISGYLNYVDGKYNFIGKHIIYGDNINNVISTIFADLNFVEGVHKEYKVTSNFELNTDLIQIHKLQANIAQADVLGDMIFYFSEGTDAQINLDINNLNFNDLILLNNKKEFRHLLHYIYEKLASREAGNSLLGNLLWLRNLYRNISFDVIFYNSLYNKHNFDQITLKGISKYRELVIKEFQLFSAENNFTSNVEVNLDEKLPFININIDAVKVNLEFLNYLKQYSGQKYQWSRDMTLIPNFNNVDLKLKVGVADLQYKELKLADTNWLVEVKNNILHLKDAQGLIDEGNFKLDGQLILDGLPTLNLNYNINKFQFGNFVKLFFNIPYLDAKANWAGSLYSSGNTPYIMMKQLRSKNKFYLADIKIDNFAIKKITQEIADLSSDPVNSFNVPIAQMIKNGYTIFQTSKGELNIKNGQIILNNINFLANNIKAAVAGKIDLVNFVMKLNSIFVFTAYYKVKDQVKKSALTVTHQLQGNFDNISGKFNLVQLESFVLKLKQNYIKLYNQIINNKEKLKKSE